MTGLADDFLFVTPLTIDATHPATLWTGGRVLWRTDNRGAFWFRASAQLDAQVSAVAVAPHNSEFVIAGTTSGSIDSTTAASSAGVKTAWTRVQPRAGWVSSLAFDPANQATIYATYAGFGGAHVWRSLDAGATWTAIDNGVPDIPVHSIAVDPFRPGYLYLGTDLGVFMSADGGASWTVENNSFAPVVTEMVVVGQGVRGPALYAFTHGRGAWRAELAPAARRRAVRR